MDKLHITSIELHFLADARDYNLLLLAAECGNLEVVKSLLALGITYQTISTNAQALAYKNHHFNVLMSLLQSNLSYPDSIDINQCSDAIIQFSETINELHIAIIDGNEPKVVEILKQNSHLRYFYNVKNQSAASIALEHKRINIYKILLDYNVFFGPNENTEEIMAKLSKGMREDLRELHLEYSKDLPEKHMSVLIANSMLGPDVTKDKNKLNTLMFAFGVLNKNPLTRILLMVVAASRYFQIIFDFNRESINVIDPTSEGQSRGLFYSSGRIYISAWPLLYESFRYEAIGTLAHELCHYAMNLTYDNISKPYLSNDEKTKQIFNEISAVCKQNCKKDEIVNLVYKNYPESEQHAELIVRAPHMIAMYTMQPEKLDESQENFKPLFDVYEYKIVPEMEEALPRIEAEAKEQISNKEKIIKILAFSGLGLIVALILAFILLPIILHKPIFSFDTLSSNDREIVRNGLVNYKNVHVRFRDLFLDNSTAYDKLISDHIEMMLNDKILNISDPHFHYIDELIFHSWSNLTEKLKPTILNSKFNFQNSIILIQIINETAPNALNALTSSQICEILDQVQLNVGKMLEKSSDFYVDRKFVKEENKNVFTDYPYKVNPSQTFEEYYKSLPNGSHDSLFTVLKNADYEAFFKFRDLNYNLTADDFKSINVEDVIDQVRLDKIFILSSEAGAGKTVAFQRLTTEIKQKYPNYWISYIDLKDYTKLYNDDKKLKNVEKFLEEILNLNSEINEFERKIFEEFYNLGNVVLLWNGFDEISPKYSAFILNIVESIRQNSKNVQYICTRPLYSKQLHSKFKVSSYALVPFADAEQKAFLEKFFKFQKVQDDKIPECVEKIQIIIQQFQITDIMNYVDRTYNTPLMLRLVAEVHDDKNLFENVNIFDIYKTFIEKKIDIWLKRSEFAYNTTRTIFSGNSKFNIIEIYQQFALRNELKLFNPNIRLRCEKLRIMQKKIPRNIPDEEISRMGILFINGENNFEFAHKTFSEFFVAQYFIDNLYTSEADLNEIEAEIRIWLFYHVSKGYGHLQEIITEFIESFLKSQSKSKAVDDSENVNELISTTIKEKFNNFFLTLLFTDKPKIFGFLCRFFHKDHSLLLALLKVNEDETFYTALFNPNHKAKFVDSKKVKNLAKKFLNDEEMKNFTVGKNQKGKMLYGIKHYQKLSNFYFSQDDMLNYDGEHKEMVEMMNNLTEIQKENIMNSISSDWKDFDINKLGVEIKITPILSEDPVIHNYPSISSDRSAVKVDDNYDHELSVIGEFEDVFDAKLLNLTAAERKELAMNNLGELLTYRQLGPASFDNYKKIWMRYENLSTKAEIQKALQNEIIRLMKDDDGIRLSTDYEDYLCEKGKNILTGSDTYEINIKSAVLHEASKPINSNFFEIFWNIFKNSTNKNGLRSILTSINDRDVYTHMPDTSFLILHKILIFNPEFATNIHNIYYEYFNQTEFQNIILNSNEFLIYFISSANHQICQDYALLLSQLFTNKAQELKEFLNRKVRPVNLSIFDFYRHEIENPKCFNIFLNLASD